VSAIEEDMRKEEARKKAEREAVLKAEKEAQLKVQQAKYAAIIDEDDDDDALYCDDDDEYYEEDEHGRKRAPNGGYQYSIERNDRRKRELEDDPRYTDSHCVWVGNVFEMDISRLYDALRVSGPVVGIAFIHEQNYGKYKNCAFAQFVNKADAKKALRSPIMPPYVTNYASDVKGGILKAGGLDTSNYDKGARLTIEQVKAEYAKKRLATPAAAREREVDKGKLRPCHKFQRGLCPYGDRCKYDHVKVDQRR